MSNALKAWGMGILFCLLSACLPVSAPPPPLPSDTALPTTSAPTPTIVWFPPTPTNTALPTPSITLTPTLDTRPKFGRLIFSDDFSRLDQWSIGKVPAGRIAQGKNELTLAVTQPKGYLYSLRQGTKLDDFYVELTASPSICRGADEYGLLVRVSPNIEFFRFALTCNGKARLDRFLNMQASSPQPARPNAAVPPGAPSSSRLAVWAVGNELRFFVNGVFLFAARDPGLLSGTIGVFVRAGSQEPVTVNFSDLKVYEGLP